MNFARSTWTASLALALSASLWAAEPRLEKAANAPALQPLPLGISGRVQTVESPGPATSLSARTYRAQWPGTIYTAAFRGNEVYLRIGTNHEILHVVVDGREMLRLSQPAAGLYRLSQLGDARHTVRVLVATESQDAPNDFGGFGVPPGEQPLAAPARPARQIEFIGDSHTVGYGDTSPTQACNNDQVWASTDDTAALGALTAAHYGADYQVNAISGRGIVRNYNGFAAPTLPQAYPFVLFDKQQVYRDAAWNPEVMVIAVGTNDFSTALNPGETWKSRDDLHRAYETTYVQFLERLHAQHPTAYFVLWATDTAHSEVETEVARVTEQARAKGIERLTFVPVDHLQFSGCNGHPSLADHRAISDHLVQSIDAQPGIWAKR